MKLGTFSMPIRYTPFVNGEYYHVFNRGVNKQPIFLSRWNYLRAIDTIKYYLVSDPPFQYSKFIILSKEGKEYFIKKAKKRKKIVKIISYCLMPNHFHLLIKQSLDNGITKLVRKFQISYTKYFNTKHKREGPLLNGQFKAKRVESENQLIHASRYIHLNPFTSYIVKSLEDLSEYQWSSLQEYIGKAKMDLCIKDDVLHNFKNKLLYKQFVFNHADYQRELERIQHLILE